MVSSLRFAAGCIAPSKVDTFLTQSRAGDVGMDLVLPHIQTGHENHLYAAAPIRRRKENVAGTLRGI